MNFLELLLEKHRMPAIFRVRRTLDALWERANRLLPGDDHLGRRARPPPSTGIGQGIGEQTGRKVELTTDVDPDILGGIVLRVGNSILDASIRNRLEQLRRQVAKAA